MNTHPPSRLALALELIHRMAKRIGIDLTHVKPLPANSPQLIYANEMLRRIQADPDRTFVAGLMTRDWYQKLQTWPGRVSALPLNQHSHPILFISGLPRSGTTFTNDLLAADDQFRLLTHADLALDLDRARRMLTWLFKDGYAPVDEVHPLDSPPEDLQLMGQYVLADLLMGVYGAEYLMDMPEAFQRDLFATGYAFEREVYRRLPIQPEQRFVSKSPIIHMMYFEQFKQSFEDYRMLIMVRDITTSALSSCHIFEVGLKYMKHIEPRLIGPLFLKLLEGYVSSMETLSPAELDRFLFLDFHRFVRDPLTGLQKLYRWLGLELTAEQRQKYLQRQKALEKIHISKVSKPTAEYYNLDMDAVHGLAERYRAVFEPRLA